MQTITGQDSRSAILNAWMCRSAASWLVSANSWIQPESRTAMASVWSFQMLMGAPMARFASVITMGSPRPAALKTASAMNRSPWLAVARLSGACPSPPARPSPTTRSSAPSEPAADEPMPTDSAANSLSTLMNSQFFSSPDFTSSPQASTMWVWGEMG